MTTLFDMEPPAESGLGLNQAQKRAIQHRDGPLLVIAGAGTGKTRVITERIRHLLQSDPSVSGENILALTFTRKAAGEMKTRVVKAVGPRGKSVTLSTFHAFCESLLAEIEPQRVMLDKVDHWILLRRNLERLKLDKYRRLADPGQFLNDFVEFFSRCQDELVSWQDYQRYAEGLAGQLEQEKAALDPDTLKERAETVDREREIARAFRASEELLEAKNRVSFGSLITGAVELLEKDPKLRSSLQQRYRYILVDEFQDTNIAQLRLLELLAGDPPNLFAVGDNDQAIYRFRGASFGSFQLFLKKFAHWTEGQDSTPFRVSLTENYRSSPNILRAATQVIGLNTVTADFPKKVLHPNRAEGEKVRIAELASEQEEACWVASELQRLHGAGRRWRDFAVLYRQHTHRDELVQELSRRQIPFVISKLSILDHPLVKDVLAYLRLIATPFDDIACARVLSAPAWHLKAEDLVRLSERASKKRGTALYDLLQGPQTELPFDLSPASLSTLVEFLSAQRKTLNRRPAREILSELLEWLELYPRASEPDQAYVKRLCEFVKEWEPKSETRKLPEFVEYLDYFEQAGGSVSLEPESPGEAVQLMTVHGAKGLEFPHVFVLRVNNRKFPAGERTRVFEFPAALMKEGKPAEQFHIQEERRLFYVALTRAQERLTLSMLTEKKGKIPVFIEDLLMDPAVKHRDLLQLMPKVAPIPPPLVRESAVSGGPGQLFPASAEPPRIFTQIARWAQTFRPTVPRLLKLSPSAVNGFRSCPQQYLFGYLWALREGPKATLSFGSIMHGTIKRFIGELRKGRPISLDDLAALFEMEWRSVGFEDSYQEQGYQKDGWEQLRAFYSSILASPPRILEQEKPFEIPMESDVVITGRMDQVNSLGGKDVEIVDYKTGKPKKEADAKKDLQLSLYALAAKEIFEWNPVRLVFHYLLNNEVQVTTRDAKQLDQAQETVRETAAGIRAGQFPPRPGFACRSCAYKPICPAHEESW